MNTQEVGLEPLMGVEELAEYLGVPVQTIYDWRVAGTAPRAFGMNLPDGRVEVRTRYRDFDGKSRLVSARADSKSAAEAMLRKRLAERHLYQPVDTTLTLDSTFREFVDYWLADIDMEPRIASSTRFTYERDMRQLEVSPDEAGIGDEHETMEPPTLAGFGLPDPDTLVGMAMRFQIAQKLHAVSEPHEPPDSINDRTRSTTARDVVDLLLLRDLIAGS